jgi:hypothetical protein
MRIAKVLTVILLVLVVTAQVFGQKTTFTIGGSYWRGGLESEIGTSKESKASNMIGPYLNIRMGKMTIGGSMFFGAWDWSNEYRDMGFEGEYKEKRTDLNLSLGYSVHRYLSLFFAFKSMKLTEEMNLSYYDAWYGNIPLVDDSEYTGSFMGGGASLMLPFSGSPFFLFGSLAYLVNSGGDEIYKDINLLAYTAGLGISSRSGFSVMAGWRADEFKTKEHENYSLKINGIMATVAYTVR